MNPELAAALWADDARRVVKAVLAADGSMQYPLATEALHASVMQGSLEVVEALFAAGVDCNADDGDGTALMAAMFSGLPEMVAALLKHGADVSTADSDGLDATMAAAKWGHSAILQSFLALGAHERADSDGRTALHWAMTDGDHPEVCRLLLGAGWSPERRSALGLTPVDYARRMKRVESQRVIERWVAETRRGFQADTRSPRPST